MPTFFVTNLPDLDASCIHRFCMSTCFALPSPLRLTQSTSLLRHPGVDSAHTISPSPLPRSGSRALLVQFLTAWQLTLSGRRHLLFLGPYLEHSVRQTHDDPGLTRIGRVANCRFFQSTSEYASSSPLCCKQNQHCRSRLPSEVSSDPL